ncbi:beta-ketoacyl synthase [Bradyrhizobium oligotrophicum S58]|uniref:Beta-ketoacyl synthase n=1 Tax=Bradyrhizobium oligotrophicum S58 TaxID=1245469 RepID=M4ZC10_9BRAD|nr:beta-ketoacyl synthase [Bradyrhizobium oligotrophicum S58]
MLAEQHDMFIVIEPDQAATDQRARGEIERHGHARIEHAAQPLLAIGKAAKVMHLEWQPGVQWQQLHMRLTTVSNEDRPQRLMSRKQTVEAATPCIDVQPPSKTKDCIDVIVRIRAFELRQQPQLLLRVGQ